MLGIYLNDTRCYYRLYNQMINQSQNKKREHEAPLFKTVVSINTDGNLIINHEYPNPKTIVERLERERNDESVIHE